MIVIVKPEGSRALRVKDNPFFPAPTSHQVFTLFHKNPIFQQSAAVPINRVFTLLINKTASQSVGVCVHDG
jgi:hypothetical protein